MQSSFTKFYHKLVQLSILYIPMDLCTFIDQYKKVDVLSIDQTSLNKPLVSIVVPTYNHEKYITKCLNSIVSQQTTFHYEILLGEDDSEDKTRKICIEFTKKYAQYIRLYLNSRKNNIKILNHASGRFNILNLIHNARGKYIAICDGDDFWTDPNKLQLQINFLEKHPNYNLVYGKSLILEEDQLSTPKVEYKRSITLRDVILKMPNKFSTSVFRKKTFPSDDITWALSFPAIDYYWTITSLTSGRGYCMPNTFAVYRKHPNSFYSHKGKVGKLQISRKSRYLLLKWQTLKQPIFNLLLMYKIVQLSFSIFYWKLRSQME